MHRQHFFFDKLRELALPSILEIGGEFFFECYCDDLSCVNQLFLTRNYRD